jgi:hypothetical protein
MQPAVTSARVPPEIQAMKPEGFGHVQVRRFRHKDSEYYYVYQISYEKLDKAVNGRGWRKKTGRVIGSISRSDGFIPNRYGMSLIRKKAPVPQASGGLPFKNYGAYAMLRALSPEIDGELRKAFPDVFREIRALALMRLVEGTSKAAAMREIFDNCCLSLESPDLAMSERPVLAFTEALGRREDDCRAFMRAYVGKASTLLFDGTSLFTREGDSLAQKGYNPDHSLNTQVRLLYMFEKDSHRPVFYTMLQGSLVDRAAFINAVRLSGASDCVAIADKGFYSKKNVHALSEAGLKYILPLNSNTALVPEDFYASLDPRKFDDVFAYKNRLIWHKRRKLEGGAGNWLYVFMDETRRVEEGGRFVAKIQLDYGEEERKPMDVVSETRRGYFAFVSNLDRPSEEIYLLYKERWDIEECFDYLKNDVAPEASHARNNDFLKGWAFINHVSLLYYYGLINSLHAAGLDSRVSPKDALRIARNLIKQIPADGGGPMLSPVDAATNKLFGALGISFEKL